MSGLAGADQIDRHLSIGGFPDGGDTGLLAQQIEQSPPGGPLVIRNQNAHGPLRHVSVPTSRKLLPQGESEAAVPPPFRLPRASVHRTHYFAADKERQGAAR
jgi:hypothetical protein